MLKYILLILLLSFSTATSASEYMPGSIYIEGKATGVTSCMYIEQTAKCKISVFSDQVITPQEYLYRYIGMNAKLYAITPDTYARPIDRRPPLLWYSYTIKDGVGIRKSECLEANPKECE